MFNILNMLKTSVRRHKRCPSVLIANFEHISYLFLVFLLLPSNEQMLAWSGSLLLI